MSTASDSNIVMLLQDPEKREEVFTLLIKRYQQRLYWHVRRMVINHDDADDILQETFIKAWKHLENFKGEASLYTWLYRIATNEALMLLKKKNRRNLLSLTDQDQTLSILIDNDTYFSGDEALRKFQKALLKLPEKQRLVFNMKYFEEMKYEEISSILGTSIGALKASYHHAVKKLEKLLLTR